MKDFWSKLSNNFIIEFIGMLVINIVVSLLMHAIIPVASFWLVFFLIFAAYVFKKLKDHPKTKWLASACLLAIALFAQYYFLSAHLPMTYRTFPWQWVRADMKLSTDTTQVKQDLVFQVFKDKHVDAVLSDKYKENLAENDPEAALRAAKAIRDKWDADRINAKLEAEEDSILQATRARQDSIRQAKTPIASVGQASETIKLHQGEQWFPTHQFKTGESLTVTVKYAPVKHIQGDNSTEIIGVGITSMTMCTDGSPAFEGIDKLSEVTVTYSL